MTLYKRLYELSGSTVLASFLFLGCEFRFRLESNGPSSVIKVVSGNYRGSEVTVRHSYLADRIVEENPNIDLVENISMEDVIEVAYDSRLGNSSFEVPMAFSMSVDGDTYDDIHCSFAASFRGGFLITRLSDCLQSISFFSMSYLPILATGWWLRRPPSRNWRRDKSALTAGRQYIARAAAWLGRAIQQ